MPTRIPKKKMLEINLTREADGNLIFHFNIPITSTNNTSNDKLFKILCTPREIANDVFKKMAGVEDD